MIENIVKQTFPVLDNGTGRAGKQSARPKISG
jgi:hypothetical protein